MFLHRLYVRIWLAVVLTVIVLTLLAGWAWRLTSEPPLREVVVRNEYGEVIGSGRARLSRPPPVPGLGMGDGPADNKDDNADSPDENRPGRFGRGPEFLVRMQDGQTIHLHLPRPPNSSFRAPFGFVWTLALVALAVALGTYPIIRRLTRRLESLQIGVERWGNGDLSARVAMQGDDEVGFLASRFNHAAEQIETLVRSRDTLLASQKSLLANASHELRSPLARIRMGLELMGSSPSPAFKQEISRNISELDQLIEEILLASRLDAKEADLGTIESVELIGLAAEECARNQAQLDVEAAELAVPGVAKLLRRAVRNLLENARRYGAGEVHLILRQDGDWAVLQVCDAGPGVPPEQQERIFEPFYRLPGASEREGGVGLGLALVKSIAERHGGSVKCSNRPEGGACFEIRLPLRKG
ncbi:MAG: HAMP domain-containing protein [Betaproteobacteria bacterium]|nr:HAMP domain-containing protein [Betaproteobacteria bacterium]